MAFDGAAGDSVLFGGVSIAGIYLNDTWTWDGTTWTQQFPPVSPPARGTGGSATSVVAYDAATKTVVLFGGGNTIGTVQFNDTWNWNGTTWIQQLPASAPAAPTNASMTFDAVLGVVVLFGGYDSNWPDTLNDTWIWNGANWRQIHPATAPPNRYSFGMDYDPINKVVLMFGGYSSTVVRSDTWFLALAP